MSLVLNISVPPPLPKGIERALKESTNEGLTAFLGGYEVRASKDKSLPRNLIKSELQKGRLQYHNLTGYKGYGFEIISDSVVSPQRLKFERTLRKGGTVVAVLTSLSSTFGLFISSFKQVRNIIGFNDDDSTFSSVRNSFLLGSIAGIANAFSHENLNWGIGAAGMGALGQYLDRPWGLALFSIFDGLNAMGMGEVKCRNKKNQKATFKSIFDNAKLKSFAFLRPYEDAIKLFLNRHSSKAGWEKNLTDEPYAVFESAGGGLLLGGGILGIASIFSKFMSDSVKSFLYVPYSLTAMLNLVALGRDGLVTFKRAHKRGDRDPIETNMMFVEGVTKAASAPVIALNYAVLGLKGLGVSFGGFAEKIAMSLRLLGVGISYIGFAGQAAAKFAYHDAFGPFIRRNIKAYLNPKLIMDEHIRNADLVSQQSSNIAENISDKYINFINNDQNSELYNSIINHPLFQNLKLKSQTSLFNFMAPDRIFKNRFYHSLRVGAITNLNYERLKNTYKDDPFFSSFLNDEVRELGVKIGGLCHDIGYNKMPRSHLFEATIHGADNDEFSIAELEKGTPIYTVVESYLIKKYGDEVGKKKAEEVTKVARNVIGCNDPLTKVFKLSDSGEYLRAPGGDYSSSFKDFKSWSPDDYSWLADQIRLYKDGDDIKLAFTEEGGIVAFKQIYYRALFNAVLNFHKVTLIRENAFKFGVQQVKDLTLAKAMKLYEKELDQIALAGAKQFKGSIRKHDRQIFGGETAYAGWNPRDRIKILDASRNKVLDMILGEGNAINEGYLETVLKQKLPDQYPVLSKMAYMLMNPAQYDLELIFDSSYSNDVQLTNCDTYNDLSTSPYYTSA